LYHTTVIDSRERTLGFLHYDTQNANYQFWMDDFVWLQTGIQAWRGEYANWSNWTNNYFYKQVIGRMDSAQGGCFWGGAERVTAPYSGYAVSIGNLAQTWTGLYTNTMLNSQLRANTTASFSGSVVTVSAVNYSSYIGGILVGDSVYSSQVFRGRVTSFGTGSGGTGTYNLSQSQTIGATTADFSAQNDGYSLPPYWTGCPSSTTMIGDPGSSYANTPNGLVSFAVGSLGMGAVLEIANASTLYTTGRRYQYAQGLSFTDFNNSGTHISVPEFAYGPLGATN